MFEPFSCLLTVPALVAQIALVSCYLHQQKPSINALQCLTSTCMFLCRCKPGFYNLGKVNPDGCQACFCFGHSLACSSSSHHVVANVTSDFMEGVTQQMFSLSTATVSSSHHMLCIIIMLRTRKICCFLRHSHNQKKSMKNWPKNERFISAWAKSCLLTKYLQLFVSSTLLCVLVVAIVDLL